MNWLAWDPVAYGAALFGLATGVVAWAQLGAIDLDAPWIIGLGAGASCAVAARDRSGLRGVVVGVAALWAGAIAHSVRVGADGAWLTELGRFHTLGAWGLVKHSAGGAAALALAGRSARRSSGRRIAGS